MDEQPTFRPYGSSAVLGERIGDYLLTEDRMKAQLIRVATTALRAHCHLSFAQKEPTSRDWT
jgi:hypothetical protein